MRPTYTVRNNCYVDEFDEFEHMEHFFKSKNKNVTFQRIYEVPLETETIFDPKGEIHESQICKMVRNNKMNYSRFLLVNVHGLESYCITIF